MNAKLPLVICILLLTQLFVDRSLARPSMADHESVVTEKIDRGEINAGNNVVTPDGVSENSGLHGMASKLNVRKTRENKPSYPTQTGFKNKDKFVSKLQGADDPNFKPWLRYVN